MRGPRIVRPIVRFRERAVPLNTSNAPPWGDEIRVTNPAGGLDNPFVGTGQPNIFPTPTASPDVVFTPFGPYLSLNYDMATPEVHQWHLYGRAADRHELGRFGRLPRQSHVEQPLGIDAAQQSRDPSVTTARDRRHVGPPAFRARRISRPA